MFTKISKKIVINAVESNIVKVDDVNNYTYGINMFFITALNLITASIVGVFSNMLSEMIIFLIVYRFLRRYVGGSHSKTALRCYISSCVWYDIILQVIKYYPFSKIVTICGVVSASVIMFIIAPVAAQKKPLDDIEYKVYKKRSRISIIIILCVYFVLCYSSSFTWTYHYSVVMAVSIVLVANFAIAGKIQEVALKIRINRLH